MVVDGTTEVTAKKEPRNRNKIRILLQQSSKAKTENVKLL